jgi:hypothetical protein
VGMFRRSEQLHGRKNLFIYQKIFSFKIPNDTRQNGPDYSNLIGYLHLIG